MRLGEQEALRRKAEAVNTAMCLSYVLQITKTLQGSQTFRDDNLDFLTFAIQRSESV